MKKTDLYKNEGLKINGQMKQAGTPDRFGSAASATISRRDQRKLEQAQGLVAFAVKLDGQPGEADSCPGGGAPDGHQ